MQLSFLAIIIFCLAVAFPARTQQTSTSAKKSVAQSSSSRPATTKSAPKKAVTQKKPTQKKTTRRASSAKKTTTRKKTARRPAQTWRNRQQVPTRQRYKEIQQALITRGYLEAPATGVWGPASIEGLKRFQQDQNLQPSGKLDSLSLIALGLGPVREPFPPPQNTASEPAAPSAENR